MVAGVAMITNVAAARAMGPSGRGGLAFLLQLAYLGGTLGLLGLEKPYVAAHRLTFPRAVRDVMYVLRPLPLAALVSVLALLAVSGVARSYPVLTAGACGGVLLSTAAGRVLRTAYIASSQPRTFATQTFLMQILLLGGAITLALSSVHRPGYWLAMYAAAGVPTLAVTGFLAVRRGHAPLVADEVKRLRRFGRHLIPSSLGNTAMLRSDRLLLPLLSSTKELGLYVVVATVMELAAWPVQNYVDAVLWKWRGSVDAGVLGIRKTMYRSLGLTVVVACALGLGAYLMIKILLGHRYAGAVSLIAPLGVAAVAYAGSRVLQGALIAHGRGAAASSCEVAGSVLSVIAYACLIPSFGAMGAAVGSIVGYAGCSLVTYRVLRATERTGRHRREAASRW